MNSLKFKINKVKFFNFKNFCSKDSKYSKQKDLPSNIETNNQITQNTDYFNANYFEDTDLKINQEINQKIFDKTFYKSSANEQNQTNTNLVNFNQNSDLLDSSNKFTSTLNRTVLIKDNKEFYELILENKLDFTREKINVKHLNLADKELNEDIKEDIYEIEMGKIKSFPKFNMNLNEEQLAYLRENKEYDYDISLLGKKINLKEENINLNNYVALNEDNKHFISPVIFHDEKGDRKSILKYEDTVLASFLKNPFLIILFIIFGYYVYPTLWKKDYFMALSEDYNNREILKAGHFGESSNLNETSTEIYNYINYRRGLYVSVRSNFS